MAPDTPTGRGDRREPSPGSVLGGAGRGGGLSARGRGSGGIGASQRLRGLAVRLLAWSLRDAVTARRGLLDFAAVLPPSLGCPITAKGR